MVYSFLETHGNTISKIILNTIFVSIPEEIYLVMFTLILTGEFDYWQFKGYKRLINKGDWSKILIPSITFAVMSNIFRYTGLNNAIYSIIPIIIMFILIVLTSEVLKDGNPSRWIKRALLIYIIAALSVGLSEFLYTSIILYSTNLTMVEVNNNITLNFVMSLPARVIQYTLLIYFVLIKRTVLKGNIFKIFTSNHLLMNLFIFIVILNSAFLAILYKIIIYNKVLINLPNIIKAIIIMGVMTVPVLNITGFILATYYLENKALISKKKTSNTLENILNDIKTYTVNNNYETIQWKLKDICTKIEDAVDYINK